MSIINKTWLDRGFSERKDGFMALFYKDGSLKRFGYYENKNPLGWILHLDEGLESGKAEFPHGSGGSADWQVYKDGKFDYLNAWSDNEKSTPCKWNSWVRGWIDAIYEKRAFLKR